MINHEGRDWTDVVARKLRESEEPLSAACRARMERELSSPLLRAEGQYLGGGRSTEEKSRIKNNWFRYTAAVAAILVCVSIGVRVLRMDHNVMKKGVVSVSDATAGGSYEGTERSQNAVPSSLLESRVEALAASVRSGEAAIVASVPSTERDEVRGGASQGGLVGPQLREAAAPYSAEASEHAVRPVAQPADGTNGSEMEQSVAQVVASAAPAEPEMNPEPQYVETASEAKQPSSAGRGGVEAQSAARAAEYERLFAEVAPRGASSASRGGAVSLFAGGAVGTAASGRAAAGGVGLKALSMSTCDAIAIREGYESYSFDHRQPLSFGVSYRHELKYGLSLETGLNYTLLRSDVALPGMTSRVHQQLHLLGIPLRLNWEFLHAGRFSMYVGAGGMVERCVSARFGDEHVRENSWLWSVAATLGAQYRLGRHVGIYFEPALSHYLTETSLQTSYTDSPVVVDLRLGLRFSY